MNISRAWATPLTIGASLLMGITGFLMFFHWDTGLNKLAHEWLGWAMIAGGITHALANWPAFARHFKQRMGLIIIGVFAVLLAGSFVLQPAKDGGSPAKMAIDTLSQAQIKQIAEIRGESPDAVMDRLKAAGFTVEGPTQTLRDVVAGDRGALRKALGAAVPPAQR